MSGAVVLITWFEGSDPDGLSRLGRVARFNDPDSCERSQREKTTAEEPIDSRTGPAILL